MRFSLPRVFQWSVIVLVLVALVGINYNFDSEAGMRMNAPLEDPFSQSLRGYWKLDEGTGTSTTADASGNANTLSMTGPPTWTTGTIGPSAMDFSGSGQYLSVADPASGVLDFVDGADFTLTGWFSRDLFAADHTIVAKKTDQTTNAGYVIWIDNNGGTDYLNFEISDGTDTYSVASATNFSATGWHNFAAVWDDSSGMYLYIDGGLNGSTTTSTSSIGSLANANAFRIGAESDAGVPFDGKIDDIRVYGYPLSASDVLKLYQTTAPAQPVDTGLVGHWTFDGPDTDPISGIARDRSNSGNSGTFTSAYLKPAIGKLGQALRSDGTDWEYPTLSSFTNLEMGIGDMTVAMWIKLEAVDGSGIDYLFSKGGVSQEGYSIYHDVGIYNSLVANVRTQSGSDTYYVASDTIYLVGEWRHVAVVFDRNSGVIFYVDGVSHGKDGVGVYDGTDITNASAEVAFGGNTNGSLNIRGSYDDIRVYNRVLSSGEIANLYNQQK